MSDIRLNSVASGYNLGKINQNFTEIETKVNGELLHTTGGNNIMTQNLDMNSQKVLNLPEPRSLREPLRLQDVSTTAIEITLRDLSTLITGDAVISITSLDDNKLLILQSETPVVITLEATDENTVVFFLQDTLQQVTFAAGAGASIQTPLGLAPYTQNSMCFAYSISSTVWVLGGDLG